MQQRKENIKIFLIALVVIVGVNLLSNTFYKRFDLTQDQRYTLSEAAKQTLASTNSPIYIDIFLGNELPSEFKKLKNESEQLLEEFSNYNENVLFRFIDPLDGEKDPTAVRQQLLQLGIKPAQVEVRENGKITSETVYPWAVAYHNDKSVLIPLLKNQLGTTSEERVNNSIQNLEYAFADGFGKLTQPKKRKVAILKGNDELEDKYLADFLSTLKEYYYLGQFTLDSVAVNPQRTLEELQKYDLLIAAQPKTPFTEEEKFTLDQFIVAGGASLWLLDATTQKKDESSSNAFVFGLDLNLNDFFFKYGVRINPNLVKDLYSAPIALASGDNREAQYNRYPWLYNPLSTSANNHPITTNLEGVKFTYASSMDTLPNNIKKTILLSTSPLSKIVGLPREINYETDIPENLALVNEGPKPGYFSSGEIPLAILLEGEFTSVYNNRIKPFTTEKTFNKSISTKMVIISDGDVIKNEMDRGKPLELGYDKWTQNFYGNKEFLLNTVNYLLDDSGLINIRSKKIAIAFLDPQKTTEKRTLWQAFNLLLPLGLLVIFAIGFSFFRKRKYTR